LLRTFILISSDGNLSRLVIKGSATPDQLAEAWEAIIKKNESVNGSYRFSDYLQLSQSYLLLISEHQRAQALLLKLTLVKDEEAIEELRELGYNINHKEYFESVANSLNAANNLITQILMKRNEMDKLTEQNKNQTVGFEDLLAEASFHLKFPLPAEIIQRIS
jgi:hypothetical protein